MKLYCATTNAGKLREFRLAARRFAAGRFRIEPLPGLAAIPAYEETGETFEANAAGKALYYSGFTSELLFADDSGLAVDALGGAPGVLSARFAGPNATDEDNNRLVRQRLRGATDRTAHFVCVIALARAGQLIGTFRGTVTGRLLETPRGNNGFGYDPLFFYPPFSRTLAEVSPEEKLSVSHRGRALAAMLRFLAAGPPVPPLPSSGFRTPEN